MAYEVEDKTDALIEKRWAEMNAAWDAEIAIEEERDLLRVEVAQLRGMTESAIRALLQKFAHRLSLIDLAEATEYLAAHEYGLALEEITQGLLEPPTDEAKGPGWLIYWLILREMECDVAAKEMGAQ